MIQRRHVTAFDTTPDERPADAYVELQVHPGAGPEAPDAFHECAASRQVHDDDVAAGVDTGGGREDAAAEVDPGGCPPVSGHGSLH
jgi:hypothetical protein